MSSDGYGLQPPEPQASEAQSRHAVTATSADLTGTRTGIMATARPEHGGAINERNPISAHSIVTVGDMSMRIEQAVQCGLLVRDGETYREPTPNEDKPAQSLPGAAQAEQPAEVPDPISADVIQTHNELAEMVPAPMLDAAISRLLDGQSVTLDGDAGVKAQKVVDALYSQAGRRFASQNVDAEAFGNWARVNAKGELKAAQLAHYALGDARVYDRLVARYLGAVPPDGAAIKAGGVETFATRKGEQMVTINGYTMRAKVAARAGLI
ncbi:MAG TPA: hypothetical protein VH040_14940 [Usitatibacter sp.]|nr:hypothetical protein [Usitatibacter sp.]